MTWTPAKSTPANKEERYMGRKLNAKYKRNERMSITIKNNGKMTAR